MLISIVLSPVSMLLCTVMVMRWLAAVMAAAADSESQAAVLVLVAAMDGVRKTRRMPMLPNSRC